MLIGYARVSTQDQDTAAQIAALKSTQGVLQGKQDQAKEVNALLMPIVSRAFETQSDTLLIIKDDRVLYQLNPNSGPIEAMSITKSIASLAIGILIDEGKIKSIDDPIYKWYPEWEHSAKRAITLRHILSHTSGLHSPSAPNPIFQSPDSIQFALNSELSEEPGSTFTYSNSAVNILSGIIEKLVGERMDIFVKKWLFNPLGIKNVSWLLDRAGHAYANANMCISSEDLAKIGKLVLQKGEWEGKQIVSREWIDLSTQPSQKLRPNLGLLWWLWDEPSKAYVAQGYLGQQLVIVPEYKIVGIRQMRQDKATGRKRDDFNDFPQLLMKLGQQMN